MGGGAGGCCPEEHRPTSLHLQQVGRDSPKHVARLGPGCPGSSAWVGWGEPQNKLGDTAGHSLLGSPSPSGKGAAAWTGTAGGAAAGRAARRGWMISKPSRRAPLGERSIESWPDHCKRVQKT